MCGRIRLGAWGWMAGLLLAVASAAQAQAQAQAQATPPATATEALQTMAGRAAIIFAGHVVAIDRQDAAGFVDVRFHVDDAVRGVPANSSYVMREWAGLWAGGVQRYQVGQRFMMLLHSRGPSGLSSPVNGRDGAIPILAGGEAPLAHGTGVAPAETLKAPSDALIDLRWVAAETLRTPATERTSRWKPMQEAGSPEWSGPVAPLSAVATTRPVAGSSTPNYALVMTLLRGGGGTITAPPNPVKRPVTVAASQP